MTDFGVDGSFTYVHNGIGGDPEDNFIYNLSDGQCEELGKVIIKVIQINDCPVGVDDFYSVDEGGTLNVTTPGILANDTWNNKKVIITYGIIFRGPLKRV